MRVRASRPGSAPDGVGVARRAGRQRGFSLLEVLVAFVVLALVGTAIFRLFGGAMGNAGAAEEWSRATLLAQQKLAQAAATEPLREATDVGSEEDGRLRWETKVAFYEPEELTAEAKQESDAFPLRLFRVTATVRLPAVPGRDRAVTLATVRLAARNQP